MTGETGSQVGDYIISGAIYLGDAGACYLAQHPSLEADAIVTIVYTRDQKRNDTILTQLDRVSQLPDPAAVGPVDIGTTSDGHLYIISPTANLELLAKKSGDHTFQNPPLALQFVRDIATTLDFAQRHGVSHNNISPDHILVYPNPDQGGKPSPAILNWGIPFLGENQLTPTTIYAPPEMLPDREVDVTSLIYSLGIIAYELLAGGHPSEFGWQVAENPGMRPMPVYLGELRDDLSEKTLEFVQTCVRTQAWARYTTFPDFLVALDAAIEAEKSPQGLSFLPVRRNTSTERRPGVLYAGIAAIALIAVLLLALFVWLPGRESTVVAQQPAEPTAVAQVDVSPSPIGRISLSADTITPDQPLSAVWNWAEPIDSAEFAIYLASADSESEIARITKAIGEGQYNFYATMDAFAPGDYDLIVRLEAIPSGLRLAESSPAPLRIVAATPTPPATATAVTVLAEAVATPTPTRTPTLTPTPDATATPTNTPAPTLPPTATEERLPTIRVTTSSANIRTGPGISFGIIGALRNGTEVTVLATDFGAFWYLIELSDGRTGWIAASVSEPAFDGALDGVDVAEFIPLLATNTPPSLPTLPAIPTLPVPTPAPQPTSPPQPTTVPQPPTPTPIGPA